MAALVPASLMLTVILVWLGMATVVWGSPKHQWPLRRSTVLWDNQDDDNTGQLVDSSTTCPYLVSDTKFGDSSFFYNGLGLSVADFDIPETGQFDKYGFTLWLKPHASVLSSSTNVALFEYRSTTPPSSFNRISRVLAQVVPGGRVKLTFGTPTTSTHKTLTSVQSLSSSSFTSVLLSADEGTDQMHVTIGGQDKKLTGANVYPLALPGKWRVGQSQAASGGDSGYRGKISCISFFDFRVEASAHSSEYRCSSNSYSATNVPSCSIQAEPSLTPTTAMTTTTTMITTTTMTTTTTTTETTTSAQTPVSVITTALPFPNPQYLWPLDNVTRGVDVISGTDPLTSLQNPACLRTEDGLSGGWNRSMLPLFLDGSSMSSLMVPVNQSVFNNDFSAALLVRPQQLCQGQLWRFASLTNNSSGIWAIEVRLEANCSVTAAVWSDGLASPCGQITAPGALNSNHSHVFTMVMVQKGAQHLMISVGQNIWTAVHSCGNCGVNCASGFLRVGARFWGSLICMAVFSEIVPSLDEKEYLDQCESYYNSSSRAFPAVCDTSPDLQHGHFKLLTQNAQPALQMTSMPLASVHTAAPVVQCAGRCLRTQHCRSFTIFRTNGLTASCQLFDFVTVNGLVESPGVNYYEINWFRDNSGV